MKFFDLHCDTLYETIMNNTSFFNNNLCGSLEKTDFLEKYFSCYAIWIPDDYRGNKALTLFDIACNKMAMESLKWTSLFDWCKSHNDIINIEKSKVERRGLIFTVEGGVAVAGDISKVNYLYNCGVRVMTLTWNGSCEIGDGILVENPKGLTDFGLKAVRNMEEIGMVIDISHASEPLFYDVAENTKKPFIATHSNSKKICANPRNLSDEQFKVIISRGGIVGITFCKDFISGKNEISFADILNHVDYFLSIGGTTAENSLCIGSDFDGCKIPNCMHDIRSIYDVYNYFLKHNYSETLLNKIFYQNAFDFFAKVY